MILPAAAPLALLSTWAHWGLTRDPFRPHSGDYVELKTHEEAISRVIQGVQSNQALIAIRGHSGLGKSTLLRQALRRLRSPWTRTIVLEGSYSNAQVAQELFRRFSPSAARLSSSGRDVREAARLAMLEGSSVVVALDPVAAEVDPFALAGAGAPGQGWSVIAVLGDQSPPTDGVSSEIRLLPLNRGEVGRYLSEKLSRAGRIEPAFTPGGVVKVHQLTGGVPARIDRLALECLALGARCSCSSIEPQQVEKWHIELCGHPL